MLPDCSLMTTLYLHTHHMHMQYESHMCTCMPTESIKEADKDSYSILYGNK